jgi:hypothetical protein
MAFGLEATATSGIAELSMLFRVPSRKVAPRRNRAMRATPSLSLRRFIEVSTLSQHRRVQLPSFGCTLALLKRRHFVAIRVATSRPPSWTNFWPPPLSVLLGAPAHVRFHNTPLVLQHMLTEISKYRVQRCSNGNINRVVLPSIRDQVVSDAFEAQVYRFDALSRVPLGESIPAGAHCLERLVDSVQIFSHLRPGLRWQKVGHKRTSLTENGVDTANQQRGISCRDVLSDVRFDALHSVHDAFKGCDPLSSEGMDGR